MMIESYTSSAFIEPNDELVEWIVELASEDVIIEVGSGDCKLARAISKKHQKIIACDPYSSPKELFSGFIPLEASRVRLIRTLKALVIAARPDHSGWVTEIPDYMHFDSSILYLGLEKNIDIDWPDLKNMPHEFLESPETCGMDVAVLIKHISKLP